jgi:adenylate cyclase class 1
MTSLIQNFDYNDFESHWNRLDEASRAQLVAQAGMLSPLLGILPVLEGIRSTHFNTRSRAKKSLESLVKKIQRQLKNTDDPKESLAGLQDSAMVSAKLYQQITTDIPFNDMNFFLNILLGLGDSGAYFAFKAVYQAHISLDSLDKVIQTLGQTERLLFVDQYLQTSPADRLKFGKLFKRIIKTITDRQAVVEFYAGLFDRKRDADPFLNNISFDLRNPETIVQKEIASVSPAVKIMGLKALSMIETKIPVKLLVEIIEDEPVKKVRQVVYKIIEESSMGLYHELFDPVLKHFYRQGRHEAIHAFKALIVTGKLPVHDLFTLVRNTYPEIMPLVHIEIASLSRISFFVIQDIALNKKRYQRENFDINLACILGMIRKRPERVVKILNRYADQSGQGTPKDIIGFVTKTKKLLQREKEHIQEPFETFVAQFERKPAKPKRPFASIIKDPTQKKVEALKKNIPGKPMDFNGHHFHAENLSGRRFSASTLFFNHAAFENTDLSNSYFTKASFKKTFFYSVNMDGCTFDTINFDNAVFINVSAEKAVFRNCSFQGARLFNCNFNLAQFTDAIFLDAVLSKISFGNTKLSCAAFAHSRISGVSFATAQIDLADFSWVRARFCRFPPHVQSIIRARKIDYNARHYQLDFEDLPLVDHTIVSEINMLIFCEFIHYGETKFLNQNKLSLLTAFDIFKPSQADFFQIVPLLIHENCQFPEMGVIHSKTPCGIVDYLPASHAVETFNRYTGKNTFTAQRSQDPLIEGLFTMGSVGSLAQTFESDIDYWVCINEELIDSAGLERLKIKLDIIEAMAWNNFKTRVTFFIVDILKAKHNDFGGSTQESSGSAQSRLLKEEFYRTMIHVAGKLPLWAVLPTTISLNYYNMILERIASFSKHLRYIDLGDIHAIPVNEYFGASIWQMFKWLKSPFKSVIKMALLEKYIHAYGKEPLLCNQYKNEWMNSSSHLKLAQNDSYIILLKHLIDYYQQTNDTPSINLVLTCFFLKLEISKQGEIDNTVFGLRKILLEKCLENWGWDKNRVFEIGKFRLWPYANIQKLSITIEQYMQTKFTQVKRQFETQSRGGLMISTEDRRVLERKVDIILLEKPHKIKRILLVSRDDRHFERFHLKYLPLPGTPGRWELYHKNSKIRQDHEESLTRANSIEEIGAWLVNNSLYGVHSIVNLVPNPTLVSHEDIEKLFKAMYDFFNPYIQKPVRFNELRREKPKMVCLFISINFYAAKLQTSITDYSAVYINSWGEMYLRSSWPGITFPSMETAKEHLLNTLAVKRFPMKTVFYFAKGMARQTR